jgi:hypothetical protein
MNEITLRVHPMSIVMCGFEGAGDVEGATDPFHPDCVPHSHNSDRANE